MFRRLLLNAIHIGVYRPLVLWKCEVNVWFSTREEHWYDINTLEIDYVWLYKMILPYVSEVVKIWIFGDQILKRFSYVQKNADPKTVKMSPIFGMLY